MQKMNLKQRAHDDEGVFFRVFYVRNEESCCLA